jgi:hypothetical protein
MEEDCLDSGICIDQTGFSLVATQDFHQLDGSNFIAVLGVRLVLVGIELSCTDQQRKVLKEEMKKSGKFGTDRYIN